MQEHNLYSQLVCAARPSGSAHSVSHDSSETEMSYFKNKAQNSNASSSSSKYDNW